MEQFKSRESDLFSYNLYEITNRGGNRFDDAHDCSENFIEHVALLDEFVQLNEPVTKSTGHAEYSGAKIANTAKKRTNSVKHGCHSLFDNIENGK